MPLGGVLGTRIGMGGGGALGLPQGRRIKTTFESHGSGLRTSSGRPSAMPAGAAPDAEREAEQARLRAERQAAANARNQAKPLPTSAPGEILGPDEMGPPNPYADIKKDPETEAYKKAVGGGSMGTKPDFTGRDDALKELDQVNKEIVDNMTRAKANPFSVALGIGKQENDILTTRRQILIEKAQREERLAYQRAVQAQQAAAAEDKELVPDAIIPGTGGQRVVRDRSGRMTPAEVQRQIKNEGPLAAEFNPYSGAEFATVKDPVIDESYARASLPKRANPTFDKDPAGNPYWVDDGKVTPAQVPGWTNTIETVRQTEGIRTPGRLAVKQAVPGAAPKTSTPKEPKPKTYGDVSQKDEAIQKRYKRLEALEPDGGQYLDVKRKQELYAQAEKEVEAEVAAPASSGDSDGGWVPRKIKGKPVMARQLPNGQWEVKP